MRSHKPSPPPSWLRLLALCAVALGAAFAAAPAALADLPVCGPGSGPEDCQAPTAVAVDRANAILYVADDGNQQVDAFDADSGAYLDSFDVGGSITDIAVDNDTTTPSPAAGDVYVFETGDDIETADDRVLKLSPTGGGSLTLVDSFGEGSFAEERFTRFARANLDLGPGGVVHVADNIGSGERRLQKFDHDGTPLVEPAACDSLAPVGEHGETLRGFALDSGGAFYMANGGDRPIRKYDPACAPILTPPFDDFHRAFNNGTLAVDAADDLYVGNNSGGGTTAIYHYDSAGAPLRVIYAFPTLQRRPISLAPHSSAGGDVFAVESSLLGEEPGKVAQISFPPPGPVVEPHPGVTRADPVGNTFATLNARINPEGTDSTTYRFEYVDDAEFQANGFANAEATPETAVPAETPDISGLDPLFWPSAVSAQIGCSDPQIPLQAGCLDFDTTYHFRAVASTAEAADVAGPAATFTTLPAFELLDTYSTAVGSKTATLSARVNPFGLPTTAHFEYVEEATYLTSGFAEASETEQVDFGDSEQPVTRSVDLDSLSADTAYRYRVVVQSAFGDTEQGPARSLHTYPLLAAGPDDCPNAAIREAQRQDLGLTLPLPDCRAYEMVSPIDKKGGQIVAGTNPSAQPAGLFQSAADVGASGRGLAYSSEAAFADAVSAPFVSQYIASRSTAGWSTHGISPPRERDPIGSLLWIDNQYKAFSEDLRYGWLRSDTEEPLLDPAALPDYPNLYRLEGADDSYRAQCPVAPPTLDVGNFVYELLGFSADAERTALRANDVLLAEAHNSPDTFQTYICSGGGDLVLASVLPPAEGGAAATGHSSPGTHDGPPGRNRSPSIDNALSADGERLYWTESGGSGSGPGTIYLRERPFAAGAECSSEASPCTRAVSGLVSAEPARYWTASPDGSVAIFSLGGSLYRYDAEAASAEQIATGFGGLAGWSEDVSRLYLTSDADLDAGGPGAAGEESLYLFEHCEEFCPAEVGEQFTLVAELAGGTSPGSICTIDAAIPYLRCARASADGRSLAFLSTDPLSGYDNADAQSGQPAVEVFLFDAAANGGAGELLCVSCNPSGARPEGRVSVAGSVAARIPKWESAFRASRALSADGERLFFESFDALLPTDTNGALDVYQWQRAGSGDCEEGDQDFFEANGGCIALISSGRDPEDSEFLDADADGTDVFFKTSQSLVASDPELIDVYDARVGGGFEEPPAPPEPCEGEGCRGASPQAPGEAGPGSSAFQGPGNPDFAPQGAGDRCRRLATVLRRHARAARRLALRARRMARLARRSPNPRRARAARPKARRYSRAATRRRAAAKRLRTRAKRCRARAGADRRAQR